MISQNKMAKLIGLRDSRDDLVKEIRKIDDDTKLQYIRLISVEYKALVSDGIRNAYEAAVVKAGTETLTEMLVSLVQGLDYLERRNFLGMGLPRFGDNIPDDGIAYEIK